MEGVKMNEYEKILHVAFVDYFLLMQRVEDAGCGWTDEYLDEASTILDDLMKKYAVKFRKSLDTKA